MTFIIWTIFKGTVQGYQVHSHCCAAITTTHLQNSFIWQTWNSVPLNTNSSSPAPPVPGTHHSTLCLYDFDYFRKLIQSLPSCGQRWLFLSCLFHILCPSLVCSLPWVYSLNNPPGSCTNTLARLFYIHKATSFHLTLYLAVTGPNKASVPQPVCSKLDSEGQNTHRFSWCENLPVYQSLEASHTSSKHQKDRAKPDSESQKKQSGVRRRGHRKKSNVNRQYHRRRGQNWRKVHFQQQHRRRPAVCHVWQKLASTSKMCPWERHSIFSMFIV